METLKLISKARGGTQNSTKRLTAHERHEPAVHGTPSFDAQEFASGKVSRK